MLRIKLPGGRVSPAGLRAIGEISNAFGRGDGELSTRQNVQLHWLELGALPEVFDRLHAAGLTIRRRLRRRGAQHHRLPGRRARAATSCSTRSRSSTRRPSSSTATPTTRPAAQAQDHDRRLPDRCNAPEINCIALVGVDPRRRRGVRRSGRRRALVRAAASPATSASSSRRRRRSRCSRALLDAWKEDLRYRVSRVKARMKFMVDDYGPEGMRAEVERRLGRRLADFELPPPGRASATTSASTRSSSRALLRRRPGPPRPRLRRPDDRASPTSPRALGGDVRLTRQQNFVAHDVPEARVDETVAALGGDRLPARRQPRARGLDRLHRRAALQLLGHRDEDAARLARPAPRGALRRRHRRPAPAPRRLPARVRAPLGRRHRLPGDDRARRRGQAAAGLRRLPARRARPAGGDRAAGLPARADRGAGRDGRPARRGWLAARGDGRGLPRVLRPDERRRAGHPGRPRAGAERREDEGGGAT